MSKSILVIDTSDNCCDCPCRHMAQYLCGEDELLCGAKSDETIWNEKEKPDWCPLRDLPGKANHPNYCDNGRYDKGWNDCIDEILKGDGVE